MTYPDLKLAIVVVNYGSHGLLSDNVAPIAAHTPDADIIIVDNFSTLAERRKVAEVVRANGWTLVETATNLGFGGGMNLGVKLALKNGAGMCLLLNPDASIDKLSLAHLRSEVSVAPMVMMSPMVYTPSGRLWFGGNVLDLSNGAVLAERKSSLARGRTEPWLSGACLAVSAKLWLRIGGFDERYFLYWEDIDLSRRVLNADGEVRILRNARAIHDEGGTHNRRLGSKSELYYYYNIRNRILYSRIHLGRRDQLGWILRSAPAAWEVLTRGGRRQFLQSTRPLTIAVRATVDGIRYPLGKRPQ